MKQIAVISGKGGSGKTSLSSSFISLASPCIICDCDVESPNLHILLQPKKINEEAFYGLNKAYINKEKCIECGLCLESCRFSAIETSYEVLAHKCEGCGVCSYVCPVGAVEMKQHPAGTYFKSATRYGTMVHAKLGIGEKNSGKLVSLLRKKAKEAAAKEEMEYIIIDGPPGTGCPVIATLSNVDLAVIVTEPTLSAVHDMMRVIELCQHFRVKFGVVINKKDLNPEKSEEIKKYCRGKGIPLWGELPFDPDFRNSIKNLAIPAEYSEKIKTDINSIWYNVIETL
ncbi:ATP-binding protein [Thermosyntropha sp.]|uniref:ATP-binding protein n=1 Tax=Thermosyntropha sp. TaxID=2740820 RepID=UPI0025F6C6F8|nr:ATP-binding protein [Thermosyntropha sp.]MBO8158235.1 P-loop NTPase [Thermosyntropha sp.]